MGLALFNYLPQIDPTNPHTPSTRIIAAIVPLNHDGCRVFTRSQMPNATMGETASDETT
jgi:hypothetical protein